MRGGGGPSTPDPGPSAGRDAGEARAGARAVVASFVAGADEVAGVVIASRGGRMTVG